MTNIAILIGNTEYSNLQNLDCCSDDILAIKELLDGTQKFEKTHVLENLDSDTMKNQIRDVVEKDGSYGEIFVYFSGHGYQNQQDFYYCATKFDIDRPNETGLSNTELHDLLRDGNAELVVKVIDACSSGQLLLKSDGAFMADNKGGFKGLVQIASCLDSQSSLTGKPLSLFTEKFRNAALRKETGEIFYSDIINTLRDEFLDNNSQTPHFVTQGTARDQFVSDASLLENIRKSLAAKTQEANKPEDDLPQAPHPSVVERLQSREREFTNKEQAEKVITTLFEKILEKITTADVANECYSCSSVEHSDFYEDNTHNFIVRVLSRENRPDKYVTAEVTRQKRRRVNNRFTSIAMASLGWMTEGDDYVENYDLELNCSLNKVQLKVTLIPKFRSLEKIELIISCAPSLTHCYIFEMLKSHQLNDWDGYDYEGREINSRWYKFDWSDEPEWLAEKVVIQLKAAISDHIESIIDK